MNDLEKELSCEILDGVAVTAMSGKRIVLPPGVVKIRSMSQNAPGSLGELVIYVDSDLQFNILKGEFKRLAGSGKIKVM